QCRALHPSGEGNHILCADYIGPKCALECGIESYVAGAVDDYIDVVSHALRLFFCVSKILISDITTEHKDFLSNEAVQRISVPFTKWIEWRSGQDAVPETGLRLLL